MTRLAMPVRVVLTARPDMTASDALQAVNRWPAE